MKKIIVAIDGYSSCGKSTIAKALAKYAGYTYVDTGAMYRAIALFTLRNGLTDDAAIIAALPQIEVGFVSYLGGRQCCFPYLADQRGACVPGGSAAEDGRSERYRDGRSRYRNGRFSEG